MLRKVHGIKAAEVAKKLGLKEAAYTRYERGEGAITIDKLRHIAEVINADPLQLLVLTPDTFVKNGNTIIESGVSTPTNKSQVTSEFQLHLTLKLIESVTRLSEQLIGILGKK
jgi:transcriptional regulator with XRE-family HTH domain